MLDSVSRDHEVAIPYCLAPRLSVCETDCVSGCLVHAG
jgi:hypothetical protein